MRNTEFSDHIKKKVKITLEFSQNFTDYIQTFKEYSGSAEKFKAKS